MYKNYYFDKRSSNIPNQCELFQELEGINNESNNERDILSRNLMFSQSYVPCQKMEKVFMPSVALRMGTIFPELVSPYMPKQSVEFNNFLAKTNDIEMGCNK